MRIALPIAAALVMTVLGTVYVYGMYVSSIRNKKRMLMFKAGATFTSGLLTLVGALTELLGGGDFEKGITALIGAAGILVYACADVVLEVKFIGGVCCFGLGHIIVIYSLFRYASPDASTLAYLVVIYALGLVIFGKYLSRLKGLKIPGMLYAALLCFMSAVCFTLMLRSGENALDIIRFAGSLCFVISDSILGMNFIKRNATLISKSVLMLLYYLAIYALGLAYFLA